MIAFGDPTPPGGPRARPPCAAAVWISIGLLSAAIADWFGLRRGWLHHDPGWLALAVSLVLAGFLVRLVGLALWSARHRSIGSAELAEALALIGVVVSLGAGLANWAYRLQGFTVLLEGETRPLFRGIHLDRFDAGPFADADELGITLALVKVELVPSPEGGLNATSRLRVIREGEAAREMVIGPGRAGESGTLRFFQGAFGFAPRIVVTSGESTLVDRVVPFLSRRLGKRDLAFEGTLAVEDEGLAITGAVTLEGLDERAKGHPTLFVSVHKGGRELGAGPLSPGHFADLAEGYRVGFAGLKNWAEIDVSRRSYPAVILAGALLALAGGLARAAAAWRGR